MGMRQNGNQEVGMNRNERNRLESMYERTAADFDYAVRAGLHSESRRLARQLTRLGSKIGR